MPPFYRHVEAEGTVTTRRTVGSLAMIAAASIAVVLGPESTSRLADSQHTDSSQKPVPRDYTFKISNAKVQTGTYTVLFLPECDSCSMKQIDTGKLKTVSLKKNLIVIKPRQSIKYQEIDRIFSEHLRVTLDGTEGLSYEPFMAQPFYQNMNVRCEQNLCTFTSTNSMEYVTL
jgi:hypothetical protein